jgi:hypothetical protein
MSEQDADQPRTDDQGNEIDMSAHIPEGTDAVASQDIHPDDRNMAAKHNELGEGLHPTSVTFGTVVSDHATDAAGNTPADIAARTEPAADEESSGGTSKPDKEKDSGQVTSSTTSTTTTSSSN